MCDYSAICVTRWYTAKYPPLCSRRGYICVICAELLTINGVFCVPLCSTKIANLGQTANFYQQNFLPPPIATLFSVLYSPLPFSPACRLSVRSFVCLSARRLFVCLFVVCLFVCLSKDLLAVHSLCNSAMSSWACRRISSQSISFVAAQCHPEQSEGSPHRQY